MNNWEEDQERYNTGLSPDVLIINQLAAKYGYSRAVIREAVLSPMEFIYNMSKEIPRDYNGPYPEFYIQKYGKFRPKWKYSQKKFDQDDNKGL